MRIRFDPATKPVFESEPVEISEEAPELRNWFTLIDVRDVVDRYAASSGREARDLRDKHAKGLISGQEWRGKRKDGSYR